MKKHSSAMAFHQGKALITLASIYPTLTAVVLEAVQNGLDAEADNIWINVDFKRRLAKIEDDGFGRSQEEFEEALQSICDSEKKEDQGKMGRFGIGMISPLGKCVEFTFTSTPKSNSREYLQWTFNTEEIEKQETIRGIPFKKMEGLFFDRSGNKGVSWRSQVRITKFTKDRSLSKMTVAILKDEIRDRFSIPIKRKGTKISIVFSSENGEKSEGVVTPEEYSGLPIKKQTYCNDDAGTVVFNLFVAQKGPHGRQGKLYVGEFNNDFRVPFLQFAKTASLLKDEIAAAMASGVFEGEIIGAKIKLLATRKGFELSDALVGFCQCIEDWYETTGRVYIEEVKETSRDERYQKLGLRSMTVLEKLLENPDYAYLNEILKRLKGGVVDRGPQGDTDERVGKLIHEAEPINTGTHPGILTGTRPQVSLGVEGNRGRQRTACRNKKIGLTMGFSDLEGSEKIWELNRREGMIVFNARHPYWLEVENNDRNLMKYQEHIMFNVLLMETLPDSLKASAKEFFIESVKIFVFELTRADDIAGRHSRKPTKK